MKKQYQNIGAQIRNLETNKRVDKTTIDLKCFEEKTYLDLINPYSDLIALGRDEKDKHVYPERVDFNEYLEYNKIDTAICNYLHILIGCFEKMMKNFLMHKYCLKMKSGGDPQVKDFSWTKKYCKGQQVFDLLKINEVFLNGQIQPAKKEVIERRTKVLETISTTSTVPSKNHMIKHYQEKYGYVPMFVVIHSLSLGQLLTLFSMLSQQDKNELVCIFNNTKDKRYTDAAIEKFEKDAVRIQVIRNIINHYEPIFPFIKNTEFRTFNSLTDLFEKLKQFYKRSVSYFSYEFNVKKNYGSKSPYSLEFHIKVERVIDSLK